MTEPIDKIKGGMIRLNGGPRVAVESPEGQEILAHAKKLMQENPEVVPTVSINDGPALPAGSPELEAEIERILSQTLFYLRNKERGYLGNSPLWWAEGGAGYTDNLDKAQKFEEEEAEQMVRGNPEKWEAWPCVFIDKMAYKTFDSQNFRAARDIIADFGGKVLDSALFSKAVANDCR